MSNSPPLSSTERTRLRRIAERGQTDRRALHDVLDATLICHRCVIVDGSVRVFPTGFGRLGDTLYVHGSTGARSLREGGEICVTVTRVEGVVLARSVFHHSMNYRSAMIFGRPRVVTAPEEKLAGLRAVVEHLTPGRWDIARLPTRKELAKTALLALPLEEASVKVRQEPPNDEEDDYALDVWAGELPLSQIAGDPIPDPLLRPGTIYSECDMSHIR